MNIQKTLIHCPKKGGLSNIWGTLSSPFYKKDIEHWGLSYEEFYKQKDKVLEIIPISSSDDNLNNFFNTKIGQNHTFDISLTSNEILKFLTKNENQLNKNGFFMEGRNLQLVTNIHTIILIAENVVYVIMDVHTNVCLMPKIY